MTTFPILNFTILAGFVKLRDTSWPRSSQWLIIKISPDERGQSLLQLYNRSYFEGTRPPVIFWVQVLFWFSFLRFSSFRVGTIIELERRSRAFIWYNFYEMAFRGRCPSVESASRCPLLVLVSLVYPSKSNLSLIWVSYFFQDIYHVNWLYNYQ